MRHFPKLLILVILGFLVACAGTVTDEVETGNIDQEVTTDGGEESPVDEEQSSSANQEETATACGVLDPDAPMDEVTLRLSWRWKAEFAPLVLSDDKGFFEEQNIDVELLEGQGSGEGVTLVGNKSDDFGYLAIPTIAIGISRGVPIQVVSAVMAKHPSALAYFEDLGVEEPKDLEGKSLALSPGEAFAVLWPSFAAEWDIDTDTIQTVQLDSGILSQAFLEGQVDVIPVFVNNELPQLRNASDRPIGALSISEWGFNSLANGIVTHHDLIDNNPGLVCRFVTAVSNGYEYAREHPEEAVDAIISRSEELGSQPREVLLEQVQLTLDLIESPVVPDDMPIGWMSDEDWNATVDPLVENGAIEERPSNDALYTNEFIVTE